MQLFSRIVLVAFSLAVGLLSLWALLVQLNVVNPRSIPILAEYLPVAANDQEALRKDPANPYLWCAAAENMASAGKAEQARYCIRRCAELAPHHAAILMRVANFYFSEGDNRAALEHTARILATVPDFDSIIFSYYRRLDIPLSLVLSTGLPNVERPWQSYFENLVTWAKPNDVAEAWKALAEHRFVSGALVNRYVQYLIDQRLYETAAKIWVARLGDRQGDYLKRTFVFNGGFESELTGNAFDWNITECPGVQVARSSQGGYEGNSALIVEFSGEENVTYYHTAEAAWLPAGSYRFSAYARSQAITTDQGLYFRIIDHDLAQRLDVRTPQLRGTMEWEKLEADLSIRPPGTLVRVQLCRDPSFKIESKIRGKAWIDNVSITRR